MKQKLTMLLMTLIFLLIVAPVSAQVSPVDTYKKVGKYTIELAPTPTLGNDVLTETKGNGMATEQATYNQSLTGKTKLYDMTDTKISHMPQPNKSTTNPTTPITSTRVQATSVSVRALQSKNVGDAPFTAITKRSTESQQAITFLYDFEIAQGSNGAFSPDGTTTRAHAAKSFLNSLKEEE